MNIPRATFESLRQEIGFKRFDRFTYDQDNNDESLHHIALALLPTLNHPNAQNQLFLDHILLATCGHVLQRYVRGGRDTTKGVCKLTHRQVSLAKELIAGHLSGDLSVETLASACSLSRSHFSRAFKQTVGATPHAWLMQLRLETARELLQSQPSKPISSIALECGFSDQSHLTRVFTRVFGVPPASWRRGNEARVFLTGKEL
jgi:AraC family transcriptional regulator